MRPRIKPLIQSMPLISAIALMFMGALTMLGWIMQVPSLVRYLPGANSLPFLVAFGMLCAGSALLLLWLERRRSPSASPAGEARSGLLAAVWVLAAQLIVLGVVGLLDWYRLLGDALAFLPATDWLQDSNRYTGRIRPFASAALILCGMTLLLQHRARQLLVFVTVYLQLLLIALIALLGLFGELFSFPQMFTWGAAPVFSASVGLLIFSLGLDSLLNHQTRQLARVDFENSGRRAIAMATGIALGAGLAGVMGGIASLYPLLVTTLEGKLYVELEWRVQRLEEAIEGANQIAYTAHRHSHGRQSQEILQHYLSLGYLGGRIRDASGHVLHQAGTVADAPELAVRLANHPSNELIWNRGMILRTRLTLESPASQPMVLELERPLPVFEKLHNTEYFSDSLDFALCARDPKGLVDCFPFRSAGHKVLRGLAPSVRGTPIPVTHALAGHSGVIRTTDYRSVNIIGAYKPLGQTGLGAVLKIDAQDLYAPAIQRGTMVLLVALLMAFLAIAMLRRHVAPLLQGLRDEIRERARTELLLRAAKEEAEKANIAKSRFLAAMSHEIRTPMNGVLGMGQLLQQPGLNEAERLEYANTILSSGRTLLTLLDDILDLSKVEAGKLELREADIDLASLLQKVTGLFSALAAEKGLALKVNSSVPSGLRYRADEVRLRQMLSNLIGNAIKFTQTGYVRVEVRQLEANADRAVLEFSVVDTGIGVAATEAQRLFQPFSQTEQAYAMGTGGTGLGLSIVLQLARLMGGDAGFESSVDGGSRFWFRICASLVAMPPYSAESYLDDESDTTPGELAITAGVSSKRMRVLVADDVLLNRMIAEKLLLSLGCVARCVDDGQAAVDVLAEGDWPDLVLMDCQMPVMDGYEATRQLRALERKLGRLPTPVIALTAAAFADDRDRALAAGMDDHLTKPLQLDVLAKTLRRWSTHADRPAS